MCRGVPCVDCMYLMFLVSWKPNKCEMPGVFLVLGIPGHGPRVVALGAIWRGSWVGTCGLCPGVVQMVCQQQVQGTEVTSRLVLGESSVPFHPYACACSGPLGTTPRNSCVKCPPGLTGGMFPFGSCLLSAPPRNSCIGAGSSAAGWDQAPCIHASAHSPCSFWEIPMLVPTKPAAARIRHCACTHSSMAPTCSGLLQGIPTLAPHQVPLLARGQSHMHVPPECSGELPFQHHPTNSCTLPVNWGTFWPC